MIKFTKQNDSDSFRKRVLWIRRFFVLIMILILGRTFYLQVFERGFLEERAQVQHKQSSSIKLQRGAIFDADGGILAVSLPMDSFFAIPYEIEDPLQASESLSLVLDQNPQKLYDKLTQNSTFVWLQRNLKPEKSRKIKELQIKGIHSLLEYQRFYPLQHHASQLIGFSGIDSQGLEGIEYQYNRHLMGKTRKQSFWDLGFDAEAENAFSGGTMRLTIRSTLQYLVEEEIKKALQSMKAKHGIGIVMETRTGKILAMASLPDFNPNKFDRFDRSRYFNRAIGATYEPGSTFKIVTVATALQHEFISKDNIFFCEDGEYKIYDRVIHDTKKNGWLTIDKIIQKSSNICAAKIGLMINKPLFYKTIKEFGFGSKTGIDLPGEATGKVFDYQKWTDIDVATISYGHSISATPIQVLRAINVVATGGLLVEPYVIEEIVDADGQVIPMERGTEQRVLSTDVAKIVKEYMVGVTHEGGTGYQARIDGVEVAGKTGTSRKFDSELGEYSSTKNISSFVGFVPAEDPMLTILVIVDEPKSTYFGSKSAAPLFREIAKGALQYYPRPDRWLREDDGGHPTVFGSPEDDLLIETTSEEEDFSSLLKGRTLRESLLFSAKRDLKVEVVGTGIVKKVVPISKKDRHYRLVLGMK